MILKEIVLVRWNELFIREVVVSSQKSLKGMRLLLVFKGQET